MTIHYKKISVIKEVPISKTCDKCGKTYSIEDNNSFDEAQEFLHMKFEGGYGSVFGDGSKVEADICQHCLKEMIIDFCRISNPYQDYNK